MTTFKETITVISSKNLNLSTMWNPRKEIVCEDSEGNTYTAKTATNAGFVYGLSNYMEGKKYSVEWHETAKWNIILDYMKLVK